MRRVAAAALIPVFQFVRYHENTMKFGESDDPAELGQRGAQWESHRDAKRLA